MRVFYGRAARATEAISKATDGRIIISGVSSILGPAGLPAIPAKATRRSLARQPTGFDLSCDYRKGQPRGGAFIGAVLIDGAADLAGQRCHKFQSGTFGVALFNPAAIIGHTQASLAVTDTSH